MGKDIRWVLGGALLFGGICASVVAGDVKLFEAPYYTGKIFPTPQSVTYADECASLANTGIILGEGVDAGDRRVGMLIDRITAAGGKAEVAASFSDTYTTVVALGENELTGSLLEEKAPEKSEGYLIAHAKKGGSKVIMLKGHDKLGFSWAVISFNQLVCRKEGKPVVRLAEARDFPVCQRRGCYLDPWSGTGSDWAWFCAQAKLNVVSYSTGKIVERDLSGKTPGSWRDDYGEDHKVELRKIGKSLNPLGIPWYVGICPIRGKPEEKIASKAEKDFDSVFKNCCTIAEAGGNVFILYDDTRFPINPDDEKDFGSAREADVYFLNKLYAALKGKYPSLKMEFCPPFYWGPGYNPNYPEGRDEYLRALGERLPKEVGVCWTGRGVSSSKIAKEDVDWITGLIRRKPVLWQNGMGAPHAYGYHYVTDPLTSWRDWYYDGFLGDVDGYILNVNVPMSCTGVLTLSDALWNPKAYDPAASITEAVGKLLGGETYPALQKMNAALSYFDKYSLRVSPGAAKNIAEIKEKVKEMEGAWGDCLKHNPDAVRKWTSLERHVGQQNKFLKALEGNPDLSAFAKNTEQAKEMAVKEVKYDQESDIFLSAYDFLGGGAAKLYSFHCEPRVMTWIYGAKTNTCKMSAGFTLPLPPTSDYSLIVCGQDNDSGKRCAVRITLNSNKIFEGDNPFDRLAWSTRPFPIKGSFLKEGSNILVIENIEDSDVSSGPPFFMLNYAVIRKAQ